MVMGYMYDKTENEEPRIDGRMDHQVAIIP